MKYKYSIGTKVVVNQWHGHMGDYEAPGEIIDFASYFLNAEKVYVVLLPNEERSVHIAESKIKLKE